MTAALASSALLLTGCVGMDGASDGEAINDSCETVDDVTVVLQWVTQAQFAGYYAAEENGYYADRCLDVTIQEGGTNVVPQQVLASGNAEFAVAHVTKAMVSRAEGADIVNIGQVFERGAYLQVAWADTGIDSLDDIAGTSMGSWGSGNELVLYAALQASGVDPATDVDVVQQPFDMSLLLNREVDSVQAKTYNEYAQLLETVDPDTGELHQEDDFSLINLQDEGFASLEDGIYAADGWLAEEGNEDIAARFLAASYQGWISCRDDADACVQAVLAQGSALGATHQEWMMNEVNALIWPAGDQIGVMDEAAWDQTIDIAIDGEVLAEEPTDGYRTDLTEAALALLAVDGLDTVGADWRRAEVELTEGGA
ncbi:ABC transporter substrate-binding protein [Microbacterium halotolerans]|uniref:ABC transporter substrate-binding protein n=1 Tax=Microbacterium halotolerans TaxID=246613 RepID=UPI001F08A868|nr:ABC transporter substrate-binding protein [Microbacterium halotolerans]